MPDNGAGYFKALSTQFRAAGKQVASEKERRFGPWCGSVHELKQVIEVKSYIRS